MAHPTPALDAPPNLAQVYHYFITPLSLSLAQGSTALPPPDASGAQAAAELAQALGARGADGSGWPSSGGSSGGGGWELRLIMEVRPLA